MAEIVLVEDDKSLRKVIKMLLEKNGHFVTDTGDGQEGLELAKTISPDLLILDLLLPRMHGMDICRTVREDETCRDVKIILMTGLYKNQKYQMQAMKFGISDYIYKPFNNDEFIEKVHNAVGSALPEISREPSSVDSSDFNEHNHSEDSSNDFDQARHKEKVIDVLKKLNRRVNVMDDCWKLYITQTSNQSYLRQLERWCDFSDFSGKIKGHKELLDKARMFELGVDELNRQFPKISEKLCQKVDIIFHKLKEQAVQIILDSEFSLEYVNGGGELTEIDPNRLIYVVDENTLHGDLLKQSLDKQGYRVSLFTDLQTLMNQVSDNPPAVIIMDLSFVDRDNENLELIRHITKPELLSIPIFYMSEEVDYRSRLRAVESSGILFLSKPVIVEELVNHLNAFIHKPVAEPYRILLIEKRDTISQSLMFLLNAAGLDVKIVKNEEESIDLFDDYDPDIIIMGSKTTDSKPVNYAKVVRQFNQGYEIPIIFMSEDETKDCLIYEASNGVDGYISLNSSPTVLLSSINFRAKRYRDLKEVVTRDRITGLLNHLNLKEQLSIILGRCQRQKSHVTFGLLEIDNCFELMEKYGIPAFETIVRNYSIDMKKYLRKTDLVGSFGRGRFALVFPDTTMEDAKKVVLKIQHKLSKNHFGKGKDMEKVYCSCGMAEFPGFSNPSMLMLSAERILVNAKQKGTGVIACARKQH